MRGIFAKSAPSEDGNALIRAEKAAIDIDLAKSEKPRFDPPSFIRIVGWLGEQSFYDIPRIAP